jgi:hypothetical protein
MAKGLLGVKHGSVVDSLGIPRENVARRMGFGGYRRLRYRAAEEEMELPELISTEDDDSIQEKRLEPKKTEKKDKKESNSKGVQ